MGTGKHDDGVYTGKKVGHHVSCLSLPEPGAAGSSYPPVSVPHSTGISEAHVALPSLLWECREFKLRSSCLCSKYSDPPSHLLSPPVHNGLLVRTVTYSTDASIVPILQMEGRRP